MTIQVLTFASLAEQMGTARLTLELSDGATVGQALDQLAQQHPAIAAMRGKLAAAVNLTYVRDSYQLSNGDELALIPPVSGG